MTSFTSLHAYIKQSKNTKFSYLQKPMQHLQNITFLPVGNHPPPKPTAIQSLTLHPYWMSRYFLMLKWGKQIFIELTFSVHLLILHLNIQYYDRIKSLTISAYTQTDLCIYSFFSLHIHSISRTCSTARTHMSGGARNKS